MSLSKHAHAENKRFCPYVLAKLTVCRWEGPSHTNTVSLCLPGSVLHGAQVKLPRRRAGSSMAQEPSQPLTHEVLFLKSKSKMFGLHFFNGMKRFLLGCLNPLARFNRRTLFIAGSPAPAGAVSCGCAESRIPKASASRARRLRVSFLSPRGWEGWSWFWFTSQCTVLTR